MIYAHAIKENGQRVMLSEFALYWDMLSSIDLRTNREKNSRSYTPYILLK